VGSNPERACVSDWMEPNADLGAKWGVSWNDLHTVAAGRPRRFGDVLVLPKRGFQCVHPSTLS
jgi:hypothetical protein